MSQTLESLEQRLVFNSTPAVISPTSSLTQNWEDASLIKAGDSPAWVNVPSFDGYTGAGVTVGTAHDPRTALNDGTTLGVNADQTNPNTFSTGGPAEFALTTPIATTGNNTVALQGSSSANAPYIKAYLDTTNAAGVRVAFDVIDIDNPTTAPTSAQPFVLQYRVGSTGTWTNVDGSYLAAAAPQDSSAGTKNSLSVLLPSDAAGQSHVEVRWITADATGSDQFIAIDNIVISNDGTVVTGPGAFNVASASQTQTVTEGTAGTVAVTITRTGGSSGAVDVPYTIGGSATAPDDYTLPSGYDPDAGGVVSFADGETSKTINIPIVNDNVGEATENIIVTLGTPTNGGTLGSATTGTITIKDDDSGGTINLSSATYSVLERAGTVTITVTRTSGSNGTVSVPWSLVAGTATPGSDYVAASGTVSWADGDIADKTFTVSIVDDSVTEVDQTFTVQLGTPTATATASLGTTPSAVVTILDDDGVQPTGLIMDEISIDPPSTNSPYQYIELRGTPGMILRDVYIMQVEGDIANGGAGSNDGLIDLTNAVIGSNGVLLVRAPNGFAAEDPNSGVFNTPGLNGNSTNFLETGSLSLILFYRDSRTATSTLPSYGDDLDTDNVAGTTANVGTLEGFASDWVELDAVGFLDGNTNDLVYGGATTAPAVIAPFGTNSSANAASYAARLQDNTTPNATAAWYYAELANGPAGETSTTKTLSTTQRSANTPSDARSTPGALQYATVTATTVTGVALNTTAVGPQTLAVTFNQDVGSSLAASDFQLTNLTTGATITLTLANVSADGKTATLSFSGVTGNTASATVLSSGNYRLRVLGGQVANLSADSDSPFFFQTGDFNLDRKVDFSDLLILAKNYNTSSKTFAQGDANYDGAVNFTDLLALAKNYGVTLTAPALAAAAPYAVVSSATTSTRRTSTASTIIS